MKLLNVKNNKIFLKREDCQKVSSFKIRGAYNKMIGLSNKNKPIYTCSAGNHAQGVALSGSHLNYKTTIIMPLKTPQIKVDNVKRFGGNIILHGDSFDEAKDYCYKLAKKNNGIIIDPFNDLEVIAGQGTIGKEILDQNPNIEYIFMPIGGGGLISGVASYVKKFNPNIKIIGVQTFDSNSMNQSLIKNKRIRLNSIGSFSDGTAVKEVGDITFEICKKHVDDIILVDIDEICLSIQDIYQETRVIVEPAGALSLAGLKKYCKINDLLNKNLVSVISGANMDFKKISFVIDRAKNKSNSEANLAIQVPEKPGTFLQLYNNIFPRNVLEFSYRFNSKKKANIFISFEISSLKDKKLVMNSILSNIENSKIKDINNNEFAKTHLRYLMGGKIKNSPQNVIEKVFRFEFPEKPGSLKKFLTAMPNKWNISLFQYRNYGDDIGRVVAGLQIPKKDINIFYTFLEQIGYQWIEETNNDIYEQYLK